jgi:basic membrane lipoprotein Med (substrate-binding protein (PBP1-ABC) superfamily)
MIEKGADVMYAERFGVSDAAKERGKLAIGNVIDTQKEYPNTVVASALWNMEPTIDRALKAVKDGSFKAEDYGQYSLMKYKGSELAPLGTFADKVPADLLTKVKAKQQQILDGKYKVAVVETEPKSTAK